MAHPGRDDLTAYALGALDPAERRELDAHLPGCERCEGELRRLAPAVGVLAESVEQRRPPPELRARLMSVVREEAAAAEPRRAPGRGRGRSREGRFGLGGLLLRPAAGLAAVAILAAGAGGYLIAKDGGDGTEPAEPASYELSSERLPGAGGTLVVEGANATMRVHGMPRLERGAVYQVWVAKGEAVSPSAAFVPRGDGTATAAVPEAASGADAVLVTREPRPGKRSPTPPAVMTARLG